MALLRSAIFTRKAVRDSCSIRFQMERSVLFPCVKMSLERPAGRDKLKNIKFIPLIMAERSGAISNCFSVRNGV